MNLLLFGALGLLALAIIYRLLARIDLRKLLKALRWIVGGAAALLAAFLMLRGRVDIASMVGLAAASILRFGRLGPLVFDGNELDDDNESAVRSRYLEMNLDHASGDVAGRVIAGRFAGAELIDLGPDETRALLDEVAGDPDSLALLETWLDRHREGWREYFAEADGEGAGTGAGRVDPEAEDYEVLGLAPGATAEQIREAHRKLMKRVHPDQGGSTYLASRINEAKDRLLRKVEG